MENITDSAGLSADSDGVHMDIGLQRTKVRAGVRKESMDVLVRRLGTVGFCQNPMASAKIAGHRTLHTGVHLRSPRNLLEKQSAGKKSISESI